MTAVGTLLLALALQSGPTSRVAEGSSALREVARQPLVRPDQAGLESPLVNWRGGIERIRWLLAGPAVLLATGCHSEPIRFDSPAEVVSHKEQPRMRVDSQPAELPKGDPEVFDMTDLVHKDTCPIHSRRVVKMLVPAVFGLRLFDPVYHITREEYFRYSALGNPEYDGGCVIGGFSKALVWRCPDCLDICIKARTP